MKKKILIVESPAKIKTIKKFLGPEFKIMSTIGHVKDLPSNRLGVTMNGSIDLEYVVLDNKDKVIADIAKAASTASDVYLAPDPDREGEIIAFHIGQEIEKVIKDKDAIHRITFNEITKPAILEAVENPGDIDMKKVEAQQARRVLDRWVGYEVSPILWKKIAKGTSAGRVQSVALRLIVERDEAIKAFKPQEYWSITGLFEHKSAKIEAPLTHIGTKKIDIGTKKKADSVVTDLKKSDFIIDSITDKKRIKNPLAPFMTSTLQQAAFNRLGFSVKKTMQVAQKLYEGMPLEDPSTPVALITYMRTDSRRISSTALSNVRSFIKKQYTDKYLPPKSRVYTKGKAAAQDAHEAVRPIDVNRTPASIAQYISADAAKLYKLIWERFVACQMKSAEYAQRQVVIKGGKYVFKTTGSTLTFDGFLKVYDTSTEEDKNKMLPKTLKEKDAIDLEKITPKQHFTQPPPMFSEGSLVKELEKEGVGRPSTYSAILNTIQARKYVSKDTKKRFTPTELGIAVNKVLVENLPDIVDVKFTASMEEDLDKIAHGKLNRDKLLKSFWKTFEKDLKEFAGKDGKSKKTGVPTNITCPQCKEKTLIIRFGRAGEFVGCQGYPDCTFTSNFTRDENNKIVLQEAEAPEVLDEKCPKCSKPLRKVIGKFGPFVACSGYPDCKYIKQTTASFKCPQDKGNVVQRRWRGGKFWGCSNYPKCKFAVFGEIEETPCPQCKLPFLVAKKKKDGSKTLLCHDKACGYKSE